MRPLLLVLALCACRSTTNAAAPDWKEQFRENPARAEWGYRHQDGYHRMGDATALEGEPLTRLRALISEAREGPFKCIVHIDGRLQAGTVTAEVCTGCGILVVEGKEWGVGDKTALAAAMTSALGERPREPHDPSLEGY